MSFNSDQTEQVPTMDFDEEDKVSHDSNEL